MSQIKTQIEKDLRQAGVIGDIILTVPPKPEFGDFAFTCFDFAKTTGMSPALAAESIAKKIREINSPLVARVEAAGPFVNFHLNSVCFAARVIKEVTEKKQKAKKKVRKIMVEYSQPNTHKEFHVGHLRNMSIGSSVVKILAHAGNKVISANYIGDIGAHVARCLWYIDKFKASESKLFKDGKWIGEMYAESTQKLEAEPEYKKDVDEVLRKLESHDAKWTKLWKITRQASIGEFKRIYKLAQVDFDVWFFESEVEKRGKEIVADLLKKKIAQRGEGGAVIIDLKPYNLDIFLILKSDGASLYSTKDLALAELKFDKYKVDSSIVIIDTRQSFYFKQLFKTLELAGWKKNLVCLAYEFVRLPEGAMSSRHGNVILFDDLYSDVFESVLKGVAERHADWGKNKMEATAKSIALAAMKFDMLKHPIDKVIVFDKKEALSFDGYTGPYVLYTVARINSILKKSKSKKSSPKDTGALVEQEEKRLLLKMDGFEEAAGQAAEKLDPSVITRYSFDLAKLYNDFYGKHSVISAVSPEIGRARLALSFAVKTVLEKALNLLSIEPVQEM